ncbi:hypothetical protein R1flu_003872 [Riccia fluitans]|uniref:Uncharacterized protein n=1 Tax=Riccia fluitans TaxID=41844 RepID=A0ABD1YA80_9MARC
MVTRETQSRATQWVRCSADDRVRAISNHDGKATSSSPPTLLRLGKNTNPRVTMGIAHEVGTHSSPECQGAMDLRSPMDQVIGPNGRRPATVEGDYFSPRTHVLLEGERQHYGVPAVGLRFAEG